jgi:hypothetical protein
MKFVKFALKIRLIVHFAIKQKLNFFSKINVSKNVLPIRRLSTTRQTHVNFVQKIAKHAKILQKNALLVIKIVI